MEQTKFSSLESCLFSDKQYITDWLFISVNLYCSFFTSKDFSAIDFTVGEKPNPTRPTSKPQKLKEAIHIIILTLSGGGDGQSGIRHSENKNVT